VNNQAMASVLLGAMMILRIGQPADAVPSEVTQPRTTQVQTLTGEAKPVPENLIKWTMQTQEEQEKERCQWITDPAAQVRELKLADSKLQAEKEAQEREAAQKAAEEEAARKAEQERKEQEAAAKKAAQKKAAAKSQSASAVQASGGSIEVGGRSYRVVSSTKAKITAYTHTGNRTASGAWPSAGMVAVPKKALRSNLPFGTKIYIEGYGIVTVSDTGDSRMENYGGLWLDIFMDSESACRQWGVANRTVYVLA
jgi:3D (Asp-Asp-Asp) domain-containing protein